MAFVWGLLVGWATSLLAAVAVGWVVLRRVVALERRARQAERLAELGTLTGGLAHEIKNPLSTVQLNLQLLQEDLSPTNPAYPRIVNRLNTVISETTRPPAGGAERNARRTGGFFRSSGAGAAGAAEAAQKPPADRGLD
jgi:signal transduction histidine kinase